MVQRGVDVVGQHVPAQPVRKAQVDGLPLPGLHGRPVITLAAVAPGLTGRVAAVKAVRALGHRQVLAATAHRRDWQVIDIGLHRGGMKDGDGRLGLARSQQHGGPKQGGRDDTAPRARQKPTSVGSLRVHGCLHVFSIYGLRSISALVCLRLSRRAASRDTESHRRPRHAPVSKRKFSPLSRWPSVTPRPHPDPESGQLF